MTFKRELKDEEALAPLKEGIKNGKMGSLTVDPESLEVKKNYKGKCSYNPNAVILLLSFCFCKTQQTFQPGPVEIERERDEKIKNKKKQNKTESSLYLSILFPQSMVKTGDKAIRFPSRTITDKSNKDIVF